MHRRTILLTALGACALGLMTSSTARAQGGPAAPWARPRAIPGARNVDHVGVVVPDLEQAVRFFVDVLGADLLFSFDEGPGTDNPADMAATFGVSPDARLKVAFLRFGPTLNLELMEYADPGQRRELPNSSDWGAPHLAFYVDDMATAAAYLEANGCRVRAGPLKSAHGPKAGQAIRYAVTPFGLAIEILNRPAHMPYEQQTSARLFGPARAWTDT